MKLLLVEDETITRRGMMKHIPWGKFGIEAVRAVESADRALEICKEWKPDIVLSDICMRGMDGIALCRVLAERLPDCQIIFASGYSQKEYLKAAIELGAVQYLEKPVSPIELAQAVQKAGERVLRLKERHSMERSFEKHRAAMLRDLIYSLQQEDSEERQEEILSMAGLWKKGDRELRVCLFHSGQKDGAAFLAYLKERLKDLPLNVSSLCEGHEGGFGQRRRIVLLLSAPDGQLADDAESMRLVRMIVETAEEDYKCFGAFGEIVRAPGNLTVSWKTAAAGLSCLSFKGYGQVAEAGERCRKERFSLQREEEEAFRQAAERRDKEVMFKILQSIYRRLVQEKAGMSSHVRHIYLTLQQYVEREGGTSAESTLETEEPETLCQLHEALCRSVSALFLKKETGGVSAVNLVIRKMQERYSDKRLSVKELADEVYLTPAHLSAIFKKQTGVTIKQYLTDLRMEKAKELLREKRWKLYQVADMVGYEDAAYFARMFKAQTGMTPSEYKETHL